MFIKQRICHPSMVEEKTGKQFPLASNENLLAMEIFDRVTTPLALNKSLMYIEIIVKYKSSIFKKALSL